jgi:hypothetical protein
LPLGAGAVATVRWSGRLYEAIEARRDHRQPCDLYHSALQGFGRRGGQASLFGNLAGDPG